MSPQGDHEIIDLRYVVQGMLGQGSMGRVLHVIDLHAGNMPLACKVLSDDALLGAFDSEYRLLRSLSHPNLVRATRRGYDPDSRQHFQILELCDGKSLMESPCRDADEVITLATALLGALDHLHRHGIIHGDLTPGNVVRHGAGPQAPATEAPATEAHQTHNPGGDDRSHRAPRGCGFKLLDLGAAGRVGEGMGSTAGALPYCAPERLAGAALSPQTDLWSLGCLLFEQLYGCHPYPDYPAAAIASEPNRRGLPRHRLHAFLLRLLAPSPGDRFPNATAALMRLHADFGPGRPGGHGARHDDNNDTNTSDSADHNDTSDGDHRTDGNSETRTATTTATALTTRPAQYANHVERSPALRVGTPFVDSGGTLARSLSVLLAHRDAGQAAAIQIGGAPGTGRTRLLEELSDALGAESIAVRFIRPAAADTLDDFFTVAGATERPPSTEARPQTPDAQALEGLTARHHAPIALLIDDTLGASEHLREALLHLEGLITASPQRFGRLLWIRATGPDEDLSLTPWELADAQTLLQHQYPGRRVDRVARAVHAATHGVIASMTASLRALAADGDLRVDAASLLLRREHPPGLKTTASASLTRSIARLPTAAQRTLGLIAWARAPIPLDPSQLADAQALRREGLLLTRIKGDRTRWLPRSPAIREAARALLDSPTWQHELVLLWRAQRSPDAAGEALFHAILSPQHALDNATVAEHMAALPPDQARAVAGALASGPPLEPDLSEAVAATLLRTGALDQTLSFCRRATPPSAPMIALHAEALMRLSRHADALAILDDAPPSLYSDTPATLATRAESAVKLGHYEDARRWAEAGLDRFIKTPNSGTPAVRARLMYCAGLVSWYQGDLSAASASFAPARQLIGDAHPALSAAIVTAQGLVAHRSGDLDTALASYRQAYALGQQVRDEGRVLTALQNMGVIHHERGDWAEALATYKEALALAEAFSLSGRIAQLTGNLGNLWRYLGELERARQVLSRGLELARLEGNRYLAAIHLNLLADVASDAEDWPLAERLWQQAITTATDAGCGPEEAESRLNLARMYVERRDWRRAFTEAVAAETVAERIAQPQLAAQSRALMARISRERPQPDLAAAQTYMRAALSDLATIPNPAERLPILLEAAQLCQDRGDDADAAATLRQARDLLQTQLDAVPPRHRHAFTARRDRRQAMRLTAQAASPSRAPGPALSGASRQPGATQPEAEGSRWQRLLEVNKRLAAQQDVSRLLEYIMDSAILLTDAERGFLLVREPDDSLKIRVARNLDQENIRNRKLKLSHGIAQRVIDDQSPIITIDAMEDERYRDRLSVHDLRLRSILCVPLTFGSQRLGAIYIDNRFQRSAFSQQDLQLMQAFADLASVTLQRAQLIASLEARQAELEIAQEQVEALNARLARKLEETSAQLQDTHRVVVHQQRQLAAQNSYDNIVGQSTSLRRVFAMMDRLLDNDVPVLIQGESGTGKELVARAIHFNGARAKRPFVTINCGAIPEALLESELFGHVRGAFTGATRDKPGLFETAHTGTLLLDELGELPLPMQVKLLRVLQSGELQKVGATHQSRVDVRIIAATNRDLTLAVREGAFREDLYYRLSVVPMTLPSLRDRAGDIPLLVQHFLRLNRQSGLGAVARVSAAAMGLLDRYGWPGNVRQLEMVLKNATLFCDGDTLTPQDFSAFPDIVGGSAPASEQSLAGRTLADIERAAIIVALRENNGNKKRSAEELGIDRRTLYNKLAAYKIVVEKAMTVR